MNYRRFGNTGEKISALGFGCMRFPEIEVDGKKLVNLDKSDVNCVLYGMQTLDMVESIFAGGR